MSNVLKALMCGGEANRYVEDVFSAYTYTGTGATQSIVNGIDLAGNGGMVWLKARDSTSDNEIFDTARGTILDLVTNTTASYTIQPVGITSFNSNGFTMGSLGVINTVATKYVAHTFRKAPKFFTQATVTVSGSNQTVDLSSLGTVGMVAVKRTDSTSNWYVYHRSCTSGKLVYLNTTAAETTDGSITLSGTTLTLVQATIGDGTYIVYAWAHDTASTGIIQCGVYTGNGSATGPTITLGWEPQFILMRNITVIAGNWIADTARGMSLTDTKLLLPYISSAESSSLSFAPTATGFNVVSSNANFNQNGSQHIYLAIRRGPMKLPTVGTQVYNAIARTGTGAATTVTGVGFAPDLLLSMTRTPASTPYTGAYYDKLRGANRLLVSSSSAAEVGDINGFSSFSMDGFNTGLDNNAGGINYNTYTYIYYLFKRYPGVFDAICYTGAGVAKTESHNLTVVPELIIIKQRVAPITNWNCYAAPLGATKVLFPNLNEAYATGTPWNNTAPTASVISLGIGSEVNANTLTYVAYLFATLAGISKVGSYTGDNTTGKAIACGFSAGARFVMIKRTDSTGDWYVFDTTRTYPAGNDYHLSLNTTAAEVVTTDDVDYDAAGFLVNQNATTNLNVSAATYIFLAFS